MPQTIHRGIKALIDEANAEVETVSAADAIKLAGKDDIVIVDIRDPREMMRSKEPQYAELGLATAGRDALLDAIVAHPILLQRPILVRGARAIIARPPERLLELLAEDPAG